MADPSISIIIPAYNVEKYLKAALDSIAAQDEFPDEVILVNDGSTDNTLDIAKKFRFEMAYHVVSTENKGQGNARNIGVELASSEYLYFFDSDDLLAANFISSIKRQIRNDGRPDIVLFSGESFNDSEYTGNRWVDYCRGFSGSFHSRVDFLEKAYEKKALFCSPCLYVSRKKLWGSYGLKFGPNFREDEAIFFPLIFACQKYSVIDQIYFHRRNREGSTMTTAPNQKHVVGLLNCLQASMTLYNSVDVTSKERWHIKKRLESHCISYIVVAKSAGSNVRMHEVLKAIIQIKGVVLAVKVLIYSLRADQFKAVRRIARALKRVSILGRR